LSVSEILSINEGLSEVEGRQKMMRIARLRKNERIEIVPEIKGADRKRLRKHMLTFRKDRKKGVPRKQAIRHANKVERGRMSLQRWREYNLRLARIAKRR